MLSQELDVVKRYLNLHFLKVLSKQIQFFYSFPVLFVKKLRGEI